MPLPAGRELEYTVNEESPALERIVLSRFSVDNYLSYTSSQEIPQRVRDALGRAMALKRSAENARTTLADIEGKRARLIEDQNRIRRNLEAAGNHTQQGMEYLRRMSEMDRELDSLGSQTEAAAARLAEAQNAYDQYLSSLSL
jgi:predicted  nucleic acid-binding Zn-ribbon protein